MPSSRACKGCGAILTSPTEEEARASFATHDYKVGEKLRAKLRGEHVVIERVQLPTTIDSKAWLYTRIEGIPRLDEQGRTNGGVIGAPDTEFERI